MGSNNFEFHAHINKDYLRLHYKSVSFCVSFLTSDLTVDPPERSFGYAMQFNQGLSDPAWLQQEDELLLQLPDVHARGSCWRGGKNPPDHFLKGMTNFTARAQTSKTKSHLECRRKRAEAWH